MCGCAAVWAESESNCRIIGRWLGVRYDSAFCQRLVRLSILAQWHEELITAGSCSRIWKYRMTHISMFFGVSGGGRMLD